MKELEVPFMGVKGWDGRPDGGAEFEFAESVDGLALARLATVEQRDVERHLCRTWSAVALGPELAPLDKLSSGEA